MPVIKKGIPGIESLGAALGALFGLSYAQRAIRERRAYEEALKAKDIESRMYYETALMEKQATIAEKSAAARFKERVLLIEKEKSVQEELKALDAQIAEAKAGKDYGRVVDLESRRERWQTVRERLQFQRRLIEQEMASKLRREETGEEGVIKERMQERDIESREKMFQGELGARWRELLRKGEFGLEEAEMQSATQRDIARIQAGVTREARETQASAHQKASVTELLRFFRASIDTEARKLIDDVNQLPAGKEGEEPKRKLILFFVQNLPLTGRHTRQEWKKHLNELSAKTEVSKLALAVHANIVRPIMTDIESMMKMVETGEMNPLDALREIPEEVLRKANEEVGRRGASVIPETAPTTLVSQGFQVPPRPEEDATPKEVHDYFDALVAKGSEMQQGRRFAATREKLVTALKGWQQAPQETPVTTLEDIDALNMSVAAKKEFFPGYQTPQERGPMAFPLETLSGYAPPSATEGAKGIAERQRKAWDVLKEKIRTALLKWNKNQLTSEGLDEMLPELSQDAKTGLFGGYSPLPSPRGGY